MKVMKNQTWAKDLTVDQYKEMDLAQCILKRFKECVFEIGKPHGSNIVRYMYHIPTYLLSILLILKFPHQCLI